MQSDILLLSLRGFDQKYEVDNACITRGYIRSPKVNNCARVYRLEHNYIVSYIKISQLHVSALMAVFRLDTKSDEKLYIVWYITYISVVSVGDEIFVSVENLIRGKSWLTN